MTYTKSMNWKKLQQKQQEVSVCLDALLCKEDGLTNSEVEWVERLSKILDRNFTEKEKKIILDMYDRRCL